VQRGWSLGGVVPADAADWPHVRQLRLVKGSHIVVRKLFDIPAPISSRIRDKPSSFAIPSRASSR